MNYSVSKALWRRVEDAKENLAKAIQAANYHNLITQSIDQRPECPGLMEVSGSSYAWGARLEVSIFYLAPSIPNVLPVLEYFERVFETEFQSSDHNGSRHFLLYSDNFNVSLAIIVTPDEEAENSTCRKVLVGESVRTETVREPVYQLICN